MAIGGLRIIMGLLTNKIIAVNLNPSEFVKFGNLRDLMTAFYNLSSGGVTNGIIAGWGRFNETKLISRVKALLIPFLLVSLVAYMFFINLYEELKSLDVGLSIILFIAIILNAINTVLLALYYGQKLYIKLFYLTILQFIFSPLLFLLLTIPLRVEGALWAFAGMQIMTSLFFFFLREAKKDDDNLETNVVKIDSWLRKNSFSTILIGLLIPITFIVIKKIAASVLGKDLIFIELSIRFSEYFVIAFSASLSGYLLAQYRRHSWNYFGRSLFAVSGSLLILLFGLFYFKDELVILLFDKKYLAYTHFFVLECASIYFRILSIVAGLYLVALGRTYLLTLSQLVVSILIVLAFLFFGEEYGVWSYFIITAAINFLVFMFLYFYARSIN